MKIAISCVGKLEEDLLDQRFGRCSYFQIYNVDTKEFISIENEGKFSNGGAGIKAAQQLLDNNIEVIITGKMGPNAFEIMERADVKVYKCNSIPVNEVINLYNNNELFQIESAGVSHSGMNI